MTGWGTPPPWLDGVPPHHSEHLLRGGRYASCVHAGGLSCSFKFRGICCFILFPPRKKTTNIPNTCTIHGYLSGYTAGIIILIRKIRIEIHTANDMKRMNFRDHPELISVIALNISVKFLYLILLLDSNFPKKSKYVCFTM